MGFWPWSKKGNEEPDKPSVVVQSPFIAYVSRTSPKDCHGVKTIGKIGTYEHLSDLDELEEMVSPEWKGGTYRAKLHDDEDRRKYLGYHTWDVPGEPWLDGKPVQPAESKSASKDPVKQLQKQAEIAAAEKVLAQHQADLHQTRVKLGLEEDDDDDDDDDDSSAEVEMLRDKVEAMEAQLVEGERRRHEEDRERQWREEMKAMREESDKRFAAMMVKMEDQKQGSDTQRMSEMVVKATEASAASTKDMMTQMIGILSTPSAASKEAAEARQQLMTVINTQLEQLRSSGNNSIDNALGLFTKAIDMANQYAASGGSQENMWMMVLKEVSSGIKGAVEALTQAKQQPPPKLQAPPVDAGRITDLAKKGAEQAIKQEAQRKLQTTDTAVTATDVAANPAAIKAPVAPQQKKEEKVNREEILATRRKAMVNEFLEILAVEIKELTNDPVWPTFAYRNLPKDILDILRDISDLNDISKLADVLRKDGDEKLVDETLVEIKKDPATVKWLWKWIQEIQAADDDIGDDAETDIDTTGNK